MWKGWTLLISNAFLQVPMNAGRIFYNDLAVFTSTDSSELKVFNLKEKKWESIRANGKVFYATVCRNSKNPTFVWHSYIRGETSEVYIFNKRIRQITDDRKGVYESYAVCWVSKDTTLVVYKSDTGIVSHLILPDGKDIETVVKRARRSWQHSLPSLSKSKNYYQLAWSGDLDKEHKVFHARSKDGINWEGVGYIDFGEMVSITAWDSLVFVGYEDKNLSDVFLAISRNEGETFRKIRMTEDPYLTRSAMVGFDGKVLTFCYINFRNGFPQLFCKRSKDLGRTWTKPRLISRPDRTKPVNFYSLSDDGRYVAIIYTDNSLEIKRF